VIYYIWGDEVTGIMTFGYKNLHIYLAEAMKLLLMPTATMLRRQEHNFRSIVR
jgi:hypothetical protein